MMGKNVFLILISIFILTDRAIAQFNRYWNKASYDSTYIFTYPKVVALYLPLTVPHLKFVFRDTRSHNHLDFDPAKKYDLGIGINYKGVNLIIGTGISFFRQNVVRQGITKYTDIQLNYFPRRFANDIYYQQYRGFYVGNSRDYPNYQSSTNYQLRPDIRSSLVVLNSNYIFNYKKFSFKNSFGFNETQLKSSGSLLAGLYYTTFHEDGDSAIVILPFTPYFSADANIKESKEKTLGADIGYIYTRIILNEFHATLMVMEGLGLYRTNYTLIDRTAYSGNIRGSDKINVRISFGYDTGKIIAGVMGIYDNYYFFTRQNDNLPNSVFNFGNGKLRFFAGYRFGKKEIRKIKEQIKL